jgi:hypothetical protein
LGKASRKEGRKEGYIHPPSIKLKHPCEEEEIIIIIMTMKSETQQKNISKIIILCNFINCEAVFCFLVGFCDVGTPQSGHDP